MKTKLLTVVLAIVLIAGCSSNPKTMYCHDGNYTKSLYDYLKEEPNYDEQLEMMQAYFEEAKDQGTLPAPGSYAHMAMVFSKIGNNAEAEHYLYLEKENFPESAYYIDFILNKKNKGDK